MASREDTLNRDPISDEPGAHPIGTGIGAGGGAITGAALGLAGGPIGVAVGTVIGAVVGGLAGKGAAEAVNPTAEDAYWRDAYVGEPYYTDGVGYDEYAPAYRAGRSQVLARLLAAPVLFHTPALQEELDAPARRNLQAEIDAWVRGGLPD